MKRNFLRLAVLLVVAVLLAAGGEAGAAGFPGREWERVAQPKDAGWSAAELAKLEQFAGSMNSRGGLVVYDGKILFEWGDIARRGKLHSVRKSLLSGLYGIYSDAGQIDLAKTIAQLGIEDREPLSETEKEARIIDLLMARSGIYHPAVYETAGMKAKRPLRGSHSPGTFWYYNNWDFNVLGHVLEQETGLKIGEAFDRHFARPLDMQDFRPEDVAYFTGEQSRFPAYLFEMSARDLARFGLLYLRRGEWDGRRVLSADWVARSTQAYSDAGPGVGYGYLWWVARGAILGNRFEGEAYRADGHGGQFIVVIPARKLVVVNLSNYDADRVDGRKQFGVLLGLILKARQ